MELGSGYYWVRFGDSLENIAYYSQELDEFDFEGRCVDASYFDEIDPKKLERHGNV